MQYYIFNRKTLLPGDIVLVNTYNERQRKCIEMVCGKCTYDHAAIYMGDDFLIESDGLGVVIQENIYQYVFKNIDDACIMRVEKIGKKVIDNIIFTARRQMGMEYGSQEARKIARMRNTSEKDQSNRTFCSRFVAQAYADCGIQIVNNPNYCTPDDISQSTLIQKVDNILIPISDNLANKLLQSPRPDDDPGPFARAFEQLRNTFNEDIQTLDQLITFAIEKKEYADDARVILEKTDLFRQSVLSNCPWILDNEKFVAHFTSITDALYYIHNEFRHYDNLYIPSIRQNAVSIGAIANQYNDNSLLIFLKEGFEKVYNETITVRKRLDELYLYIRENHTDDFNQFVDQYGFYKEHEYIEKPFDIAPFLYQITKDAKE